MAIMTTALLAFVTSGCVEPLDNNVRGFDPDAVYLPIRLYIPGVTPATKVSPSDINGLTGNTESQIHCVQVWMFTHGGLDTESALAYAEAGTLTGQTTNLPNGSGYYNQNYDPGENPANTLDWSKGYWENDYTYKLSMRIPKSILKGSNLKFDFYVLANAKSIGTTTLQAMTRGALKQSKFGGDYFGTTTPVTQVGTDGLPISGFFNKGSNTETAANASGVDLSFLKEDKVFEPEDFYENLPIVQLERAVSRIRFAFVKSTGMTGVQIIKIEIDGDQIPTSTYVFPRENGQFPAETEYEYPTNIGYTTILQGAAATQDTPATPLLSDTQIPSYENPEDLKSTSTKVFNVADASADESYNGKAPLTMTSQEYNDLLDDYTTSKYVYLRESVKPIKGQITYSLDGGAHTKTADFFMKPPEGTEGDQNPYDYPTTTNFHRNHSWTVYGYFKGGGLYIKPIVLAWRDVDLYEYKQKGYAVIAISGASQSIFGYGYTTSNNNTWWNNHNSSPTEWYFRWQHPDHISTTDWKYDWFNSRMIVSPGDNGAGVPIYANRIELRTRDFDVPLRIKLSNPDKFYIVTYDINNPSAGYQPHYGVDGAEIPTGDRTTYFYVVPRVSDNPENNAVEGDETAAYLVTNPGYSTGNEKLPFNASVFPGSNENTEIFFRCVSNSTFIGYYSSLPDNVKAYDQLGNTVSLQ